MIKCPICGYSEQQLNKQPSNVMNVYQNKDNPNDKIAVNSGDKQLTIGKKTYLKVDAGKALQDLIKVQDIDPETIKAPEVKAAEQKPKAEGFKVQVPKAPIIESKAETKASAPAVELKPEQP